MIISKRSSNENIGNLTRDLPACSAVRQQNGQYVLNVHTRVGDNNILLCYCHLHVDLCKVNTDV